MKAIPFMRQFSRAALLTAVLVLPALAGPLEDGQRHLKGGQWTKAAQAFEQVLKTQPGSRPAQLGLAKAVLELSRQEEPLSVEHADWVKQHMARLEPVLVQVETQLKATPKDVEVLMLHGGILARKASFLSDDLPEQTIKALQARAIQDFDAVVRLNRARAGEALYHRAYVHTDYQKFSADIATACQKYRYQPACKVLENQTG